MISPERVSAEQLKTEIRRTFEELNKRNLAVLDEYYAPNVVVHYHNTGVEVIGLEKHKQSLNGRFAMFPDSHITIEDILVDGDKALIRYSSTATHNGNLGPAGKKLGGTAFQFRRYEGGKVAEIWEI